jgi:hypothetical protein
MEVRLDFANQRRVCAIATEVSTRASNAIVVINFLMMGLPSWGPLTVNGNGKLDHKVRQSSRFVQMLQARAMPRCPRHAYRRRGTRKSADEVRTRTWEVAFKSGAYAPFVQ